MFNKKTFKDIDVKGKRVFVRVDFNVPVDENGNITDDTRIKASLPTILGLKDRGAKIILASHFGRPKGEFDPRYSLENVAQKLAEILGQPVKFAKDCIGPDAIEVVDNLQEGEVALLENVRFHKGETKNDKEFSRALAELAEIYVNDAFGSAHRAHSSTAGIAQYLPAVAGLLMEKEITALGSLLKDPERPYLAVLGGAKVSDKIAVIENLIEKVNTIIIGGGMAYTFLKGLGGNVGNSLLEEDKISIALELIEKAKGKNVELLLPVDIVIADRFAPDAETKVVDAGNIPEGWMGLDIGPRSIELFNSKILTAKTIIWNGPMGVFEMDTFAKGTNSIAKTISQVKGYTVIGGGDSAAAVEKIGIKDRFSHVSTGGGASLEFLEGKILPGIEVLEDRG